jgi:HPt (histidine-containing phosphotransfer) domain-containing protein
MSPLLKKVELKKNHMAHNDQNSKQVVDFAYLRQVSKGDKTFIKEMIDLFISETPEDVKTLEKGITETNFNLIKTAANALRSSIPFMGLDKSILAEVSRLEFLAEEQAGLSEIKQLFTKVKDVCERACIELQLV